MIKCVILHFVVLLVNSENVQKKTDGGRQGRLFSFNVIEEDITIDLDFSVPFIRIPVKRTMDSANGFMDFPTININPASLALGGAVVLGTTVVIPFLLKKYAEDYNYRYAKILDNAEFGADSVLELAQQMLENSQGFRGCPLRMACWVAQQEQANPRIILDQIINNKLLSLMVNSSAVEDAMLAGSHGRSCSSYRPCPLQEHHVPMLMNNLATLTMPGLSDREVFNNNK